MRPNAWRCAFVASLTLAVPATQAAAAGNPYASSKTCAECHTAIHGYWSESAHARAATSPSFLASLEQALGGSADAEAVRRGCSACHAPTALVSGDHALEQAVTREGVTCDFCHTVADVDLTRAQPFDLQPGAVKRGPLQYAESPFHETAYSPLHKASPLLCAGCHEHRNAAGVPVLATWSEWKASDAAARGTPCQECHMPLVPGRTVREGLAASQRAVNLHRLTGGGGMAKVRSGLELELAVSRTSTSVEIDATVSNRGAGHAVPGGLSSKTLVLAVALESASGELVQRRERLYRRELKDAQGRVLGSVSDLFLKSAAVGLDTRLKSGESRRERFTLPLSAGARAVVARLEYRDASDPTQPARTALVLERREVFAGR
jgi:hypothetical protein